MDTIRSLDGVGPIQQNGIGELVLRLKSCRGLHRIARLSRIDADHHPTPAAPLLPDLALEMRSLRIARRSSGGEEVQQEDPAAIGTECLFPASEVREDHSGRGRVPVRWVRQL